MKITMYNWAGEKMILPPWFIHNEIADISWEQIKSLYDSGINIMITHYSNGHFLFIDNKRFGQR